MILRGNALDKQSREYGRLEIRKKKGVSVVGYCPSFPAFLFSRFHAFHGAHQLSTHWDEYGRLEIRKKIGASVVGYCLSFPAFLFSRFHAFHGAHQLSTHWDEYARLEIRK